MAELSVRFTSDETVEDSPISVSLFRPDSGVSTNPAPFAPPLDEAVLADIRWYLEVFSSWPTGPDYHRAERIEARMEEWGHALLHSITREREAARLWQQFVDAADEGKLLTVDATDPRVLRLPWELLADAGGHLFSRAIGVRRRLQQSTTAPARPLALPVRVLVIVSRPDDAGFIDAREISLPLLDALDELGERAEVEFLYPPTLKALTERLRDRKAPPVHVVHFDGHGVYDARHGLGFLLFENDAHASDRVDANRLGTLLNQSGVPLMVLNACQSAAQQEGNPYASVAARLIRAGVGSVLAMNYSVLVVAARKFVAAFYGALADGLSVGRAVDEGRYALLSDEARHTLTRTDAQGETVEETVHLRDWFLPALYQQATDPIIFAPVSPSPGRFRERGLGGEGLPPALVDPTVPGGLPGPPEQGFVGRAREMLALERALATTPIVVLHGWGGLGKTTLAAEAGRWFHRTGRFPGGAAFVSFEGGGSLLQLCSWVGQAVSGDPNWTLGEGDPVARVAALLRERPALVILDNFESVLGREPLMPPDELRAVLDAVWTWANAGTARRGRPAPAPRVLVTTRDTNFNDDRFRPSKGCRHIELGGLARDDALALAAAVLDSHAIDRATVARQPLVELMERLGGHPLSLTLVLPHLRHHTPDELSARFEELLPGFVRGAAKERNESLAVSLDFSLRRLGDATRAALPALAVFQGGAFEAEILAITEMEPTLWQAARAELEAAALVTVETLPGINFPFLRFHPTLLPFLARELPAHRRAALEQRYWLRYYALADYLYQADTQTPHQARAIALRELPNLHHALDLTIAAEEAEAAIDFASRIARFLDAFGRWRERDAMVAKVDRLQVSGGGSITQAEVLRLDRQGDTLLQQGRAAQAERLFRDLLARLEAGAAYDSAYDHARMLWWLGRCLAMQGHPVPAIEWHRRALGEFEALSATNKTAKEMIGNVYPDIGANLAAVGHFTQAQQAYENGLKVARETHNHRTVGVVLGQLGNLALRRGALNEAWHRHNEARETFQTLSEPQMEAVAWHQLGMVAQATRQWDEAERCYRESLKLKESFHDLPGVARTCNQLALVAQGAGRLDDAERWFLRAIELAEQLHDTLGFATRLSNLANLCLSQGRLDEAAGYARRAAAIDEEINDPSVEIWKDYSILAQIAEAQSRADEAAQWRRKAQDSFAAYAGAGHQLPGWAPQVMEAVVAAAQGAAEGLAAVQAILPQLEATDWRNLAPVFRRLIAGEHDFEVLRTNLNFIEAYIVRAILAQLAGGAAPHPPAGSEPAGGSQGWALVIADIVAACGGDTGAGAQVAPLLDELGEQDDWRALVGVLRRILAGERDPAALLPGLDETDTQIAAAVLGGLGVDLTGFQNLSGLSLEDLLGLVAQACGAAAPPRLAAQLHGLTRALATDAQQPAELRALGHVLNAVLSGERAPDLAALPPALAEAVRAMVAGLPAEGASE